MTLVIASTIAILLSACSSSESLNLSGDWENDVVGTLTLTQAGAVLSAEQKDPVFQAYFGPKMFEGKIVNGVLTGKIATALDVSKQGVCGTNWGNWSDIELKVSPDGTGLEGRWMRNQKNAAIKGCPIISSDWEPFKLNRSLGQAPVEMNTTPKWLAPLIIVVGLLFAGAIRMTFVNYLVGPLKKSPNSASSAGWTLFLGLFSGTAATALALTGRDYSTPVLWGPIATISVLSLVLTIFMSARR